ncbi:MAG: purine-nucleoside phosphorylase [Syntrophobacterales bacterium]|nr:purine-nucleoside phosphorylase [Syntrophobacterales bacterium]
MFEAYKKVEEAKAFISKKIPYLPEIAIILGTGLGEVAEAMEREIIIPYERIPHFPVSTVEGHQGKFIVGRFEERPVIALQGRFHLYEGYSSKDIAFPIRVIKSLGVNLLIISNAAGGLNPLFEPGDIMLIVDHINFTGENPLIGPNLETWGPRFPDMTEPYSKRLRAIAKTVARENRIPLKEGVYIGVTGPSMETAAETRMFRLLGADAIGMSTVVEVIAAVHLGMEVLGFSIITNVNRPDCYEPVPLEKVIARASSTAPTLLRLVSMILRRL